VSAACPDDKSYSDDLVVDPGPQEPSSESRRVRLGVSTATEPDVLRNLADDPSVTVRAALALNPAAPTRVNDALAGDPDDRVRALLARRLATLAPSLSAADQTQLQRETWDTLARLVADEAVRVRATIADAVKDMPAAPRELILRLAHDTEISVSEPVIRLSPLLTTEDCWPRGMADLCGLQRTAAELLQSAPQTNKSRPGLSAGAASEKARLLHRSHASPPGKPELAELPPM
jgi:hypothetical protein